LAIEIVDEKYYVFEIIKKDLEKGGYEHLENSSCSHRAALKLLEK